MRILSKNLGNLLRAMHESSKFSEKSAQPFSRKGDVPWFLSAKRGPIGSVSVRRA